VVICDRYVDSMLAYQGAGRVLDPAEVEHIARWATEDLRPDLTVVLDAELSVTVQAKPEKDRLESAGEVFHERTRQFFLKLAQRDPEHYLVLDARASREDIAAQVAARVARLLVVSPIDREAELNRRSARPAGQLNGPALRLGDGLDNGET
jgi:dTMP kinase